MFNIESPKTVLPIQKKSEEASALSASQTESPKAKEAAEVRSGIKLKAVRGFIILENFCNANAWINKSLHSQKMKNMSYRQMKQLNNTYDGLKCFRYKLSDRVRAIVVELPPQSQGERHFEIILAGWRDTIYEDLDKIADN